MPVGRQSRLRTKPPLPHSLPPSFPVFPRCFPPPLSPPPQLTVCGRLPAGARPRRVRRRGRPGAYQRPGAAPTDAPPRCGAQRWVFLTPAAPRGALSALTAPEGGRKGGGPWHPPALFGEAADGAGPGGSGGTGPIPVALSAASLRKGASVFSFGVHGVRIGVKRKGFSLQKVDTGVGNFGVVAFSLRWRQDSNGGMNLELGVSACLGMQDQPPLLETSGWN